MFMSDVVSLYPNPAHEVVTIECSGEDVIVLDILGRIMYRSSLPETFPVTINISNLDPGIYFYRVTRGYEIIRGSFIVEHYK